ncbi:MAG: endonuclease/exonuclease/phosphatase family protein [Bacteroidota bacterium]
MRRFVSYTFLFVNLLMIGWLVCCYTASYTSPVDVRYLELFSLTTPFAIFFNAFFVIFWLFTSGKWKSLLSITAMALCYKLIMVVFAFHFLGNNDQSKKDNSIKVMSWNAHGLGVFEKHYTKAAANKMIAYIQTVDPDILCMPEFYTRYDNALKPHTTDFINNIGFKEFRFNLDNTIGDKIYLGTAIFSKYPFTNYRTYVLSQYINMQQCDMLLPNQKMMRMFFIHLHSFGLSDHDRTYIEGPNATVDSGLEKSKFFMSKFDIAYIKRAKEAQLAMKIVRESPYPVLICGDLNDLPGSYTYTTMKASLKDAFVEKGKGIGRTYNQIFPTLRIDYIFYDPSFLHIIGYKSPFTRLSDHNPVIANFELVDKAQD